MRNKILYLILTFCFVINTSFASKPTIVTSITPIHGILDMMLGDSVNIKTINKSGGCPHSYHLRPSDKNVIEGADMLIYVDDNFDVFAKQIFLGEQEQIVKISNFKSINFLDYNGRNNWHFWLDLNNVSMLVEELTAVIIKKFPELESAIKSNKNNLEDQLNSLKKIKLEKLQSLDELVVLTDSLEHFWHDTNVTVNKLYQSTNPSLRYFANLESVLNNSNKQCVILDIAQSADSYKLYKKKIIQVDSDNWSLHNDTQNKNLFYNKYLKMIEQINQCQ